MHAGSPAADLVLTNARVVTMDVAAPEAQAVAIGGGRILGVGSTDQMGGWLDGNAVERDLGGRTLVPGFATHTTTC